jgi:hypothetical protein
MSYQRMGESNSQKSMNRLVDMTLPPPKAIEADNDLKPRAMSLTLK